MSTRNAASYKSFLSTETGYGSVTVRDGKASVAVARGRIEIDKIVLEDSHELH